MGTTRRLRAVDKDKTLYHTSSSSSPGHHPPIDPIREELVTSLVSFIGPRPNLLALTK